LASFTLATAHIYADAQAEPSDVVSTYYTVDVVCFADGVYAIADPNTSITFPKTMHIPSRVPIPDLSLIGVGVRRVSFLGIKVYSVAFYADLNNPALQVRACLYLESLHPNPWIGVAVSHSGRENRSHHSKYDLCSQDHSYA
jgi:hypothetical protein